MEIRYLYDLYGNETEEELLSMVKDKNEREIFLQLSRLPSKLITIEIETINRCNNDCSFCPVNRNAERREYAKMTEELYKKIIDELAEIDYVGYISLYSNNEPLIDNRIHGFLEYAVQKLPNAIHALFTNGLLLNDEIFLNLIKSLDLLIIDNYNDEMVLNENVKRIVNNYTFENNECEVIVLIRRKNEVLLNRGGLAPNKESKKTYYSPCILPFIQMVVRPDGKVSRCCQDAYGNETLGDLHNNSIYDVFQGRQYEDFRSNLWSGNRGKIPYCSMCDQFGLINYYPKEWNRLCLDAFCRLVRQKVEDRRIVLKDFKDEKIKKKFLGMINLDEKSKNNMKQDFYIILDYKYPSIKDFIDKGLVVGKDFIICESKWFWADRSPNKIEYKKARRRMNQAKIDGNCVLFGTGGLAHRLYEEFRMDIAYCIDNSPTSETFQGKKVYKAQDVAIGNEDWFILAMTDYYMPYQQLISFGVPEEKIIIGNNLYLE